MASPISKLAPELIAQILDWVHQTPSTGASSLVACLYVCKQWSQHGRTILYRRLVLNPGRLQRFLDGFDHHAVTTCTDSLTLRISPPVVADWDESKVNYHGIAYPLLDEWLRRLAAEVLPIMDTLTTMSIVPVTRCKLFRPTLAAILQALPTHCVDLELDTNGHDSDNISNDVNERSVTEESVHLCEELRTLLPRLHNIRVNLKFVCGSMVGIYDEHGFTPIKLPLLRQLLVNCRRSWSTSNCCPQTALRASTGSTSWHSVIHGLGQVVDCGGLSLGAEPLVLAQAGGSNTDRTQVRAILRCHAAKKTTWAFPIAVPARPSFEGQTVYYIRTNDGGVVGEGTPILQDILEGYAWRTLINGARLPKHRVGDALVEEFNVMPEEAWRALWPRKSCTLWTNEQTTGLRLVEAERRTGEPGTANAYDELRGLVEMTPDGWYRPMEMERSLLHRVEESS